MVKFYGVNMRGVLVRVLNHQLNELTDYLQTVESSFKKKLDDLSDDIDRRTAHMSEEAKDRFAESFAEDAFQLGDHFPSMVRKSAFVELYSFFEHMLLNLCGHVKRYGKFKLSVSDLRHKGITAAQRYLKDVADIDFPDNGPEWVEIIRMAEMRNLFAHTHGHVTKEQHKDVRKYIESQNGLVELTGVEEITFNAGYCEHAIEVVRKFFMATLDAVPDNLLHRTVEEDTAETVSAVNLLRAKKTPRLDSEDFQ